MSRQWWTRAAAAAVEVATGRPGSSVQDAWDKMARKTEDGSGAAKAVTERSRRTAGTGWAPTSSGSGLPPPRAC